MGSPEVSEVSTVVSTDRRIWLPMLVSLALIGAGLVTVLNLPTSISGLSLISPSTPAIPQAEWRIKAHPAGALDKISPKQKKFLASQEPAIKSLIRDVYDAAFIDPASLKTTLNKNFQDAAAGALLRADVGFPATVEAVRTITRRARVDIDAARGTHAAASVQILARGTIGNKIVRLRHRSVLWMEKSDGKWRVIAFEVSQEPTK
jgi:hypothetical protein